MRFLSSAHLGASVDEILGRLTAMGQTRKYAFDREGLSAKIKELSAQVEDAVKRIQGLFTKAPYYGLFIRPSYMDLLKGIASFQGTALRLDPAFSVMPR